RARQGEPGDRRNFDLRFPNFGCPVFAGVQSQIANRHSKIKRCLSVTVVLKCRKLSLKTRAQPQIPMQSLSPSRLRPATVTPLEIPSGASCFPHLKARL